VEEKLFVQRQQKWLHVSSAEKMGLYGQLARLWSGTEVRGLADVAGRFISGVRVGGGLREEDHKKQRQSNG
jgi:hypothetical protein